MAADHDEIASVLRRRIETTVAQCHGYPDVAAVGVDDDGFYGVLAARIVDDLGLRHVGWYYRYEPAGEYHWSSNISTPPSWAGVSDVQPMFAARVSDS